MLVLYDSLLKEKRTFNSMYPGRVSMYVCGVTAYDYCHIGHARTFVCFDLLVRYLKFQGYAVHFVRNITDIDDKIISASVKTNQTCDQLVASMVKAMHEDFDQLNLLRPTYEPLATEHIPEIIAIISILIEKGYAYPDKLGNVYFSTEKYSDYGQLSGQLLEKLKGSEQQHGAKTASADFALWKQSKPGEPSWVSPWGPGRPGWHIECSAMTHKWLGANFDIHGGGGDLRFPHHENEIAQSMCAFDGGFARYWVHTGMVTIADEKMSKSLNNFLTIREALSETDAATLRFFLLSAHYRSPLAYSSENLKHAKNSLKTLHNALQGLGSLEKETPPLSNTLAIEFFNALSDDLNTPKAYAVLFKLASEINKLKALKDPNVTQLGVLLKYLGNILGLCFEVSDPVAGTSTNLSNAQIERLIATRNKARLDLNFVEADQVRNFLLQQGIILTDTRSGTTWEIRD